jgi:hypothetical protein
MNTLKNSNYVISIVCHKLKCIDPQELLSYWKNRNHFISIPFQLIKMDYIVHITFFELKELNPIVSILLHGFKEFLNFNWIKINSKNQEFKFGNDHMNAFLPIVIFCLLGNIFLNLRISVRMTISTYEFSDLRHIN